jgi:hypothetical protein
MVLINFSPFELVMLVIDVLWNKLRICSGDVIRYNVKNGLIKYEDTTLGSDTKIYRCGSSWLVVRLYELTWSLLIIAKGPSYMSWRRSLQYEE